MRWESRLKMQKKTNSVFFSMPKITEVECSRTFRKQPPKMQRLSRRFREGGGRLQESNHRGPLSDVRVRLLYGG